MKRIPSRTVAVLTAILCLTSFGALARSQPTGVTQGTQHVSETTRLAIAKANSGKLDQSLDLFDKSSEDVTP